MTDPKARVTDLARKLLPPQTRSGAKRVLKQAAALRQQTNEPYALWRARLAEQIALAPDARVAFAGCGLQARNLAGALHDAGGTITGAFDQRPDVAETFLSDFGGDGTASESFEQLVGNQANNSVLVIATTAGSHMALATEALTAGVDRILIEKPVATTMADAEQLRTSIESARALVAVNHTRRWLPSSQGLRRLIASGAIGEVKALNFMWGRNGFAMIGTHLFDFARMLTGSEIEQVQCKLEPNVRVTWRGPEYIDQPGYATATMNNHCRITMDLSSDLAVQQGYLVIVGETGRIEVDEMLGKVRMVGQGRRVWETDYGFANCLPLGGAKAIVDLHQGIEPACTVQDAYAALEATIACQLSNRVQGATVHIPIVGPDAAEVFPFA